MLYRRLLMHRWKQLVRSVDVAGKLGSGLLTVPAGSYFALVFLALGLLFPQIARDVAPERDPLALLNTYLFIGLGALGVARFFLQGLPTLNARPYLHLPVDRHRIVRFVLGSSLTSLFNIVPLLFLAPVFVRLVLPASSWFGAAAWAAGVVGALLVTHFLNIILHALLTHRTRHFWSTTAGIGALAALDQLSGARLLQQTSGVLFGELAAGGFAGAAGMTVTVGLLAASARTAARLMRRTLLRPDSGHRAGWARGLLRANFEAERPDAVNLALLELKLLLRNKRPRQLLLFGAFFAMVYVPLFFTDEAFVSDPFVASICCFLVTLALPSNAGQLMFSWNSSHFDGMMARRHSFRDIVAGKLLTLHVLTVVSIIFVFPLVLWFTPNLFSLLCAYFLFALGLGCPLLLFFALWNKKPVEMGRGTFFNYEGISFLHLLMMVPLFGLPMLPLVFMKSTPAFLLIGTVGLLGVASFTGWTTLFARLLKHRKYPMAAGFRS
jgi:hypothetical protein